MLQGFKEFIMRGNVIELSTAVIIGSAFTAIVTSVSDHIINPLIASFGSADVSGLGFHVNPNNEATFLDFGAVITAVINFFIVASIVYFLIIMPINKLEKARKRSLGIGSDDDNDDKDPSATTEELLAEIRDLLRDHTPTNSQATGSEPRKDQ
ncbi:large conductance mechanosensitive channel protein MscL [Corynebacterium pseudodiphtheriticum]|uniref:large conductance mechanosensitive channel protein MscL n=1 Tax=Corynebacterium pseudodiphtheriticum TaxID=37637 RepID=UPI00254A1F80|nr:large conductance mechanosensitive channel protein MscL [Corynebacterium pseudodiphtheriticum]MDK8478847.1 large conductance mechanosensitive channel protein MscL [Corynebacterium pseudodiphtheriticum]MDK8552015.1 large conductance mechanosensitive channel protein MscL [Corynebacterium pseudodiphtheriticum]